MEDPMPSRLTRRHLLAGCMTVAAGADAVGQLTQDGGNLPSQVRVCIAEYSDSPPPLGGAVDETAWERARPLEITEYPWFVSGAKQNTTVRLLYDARALYLQFHCQDRHILSNITALNGLVCNDSCVEFFATPDPAARPDYINLEFNCCGVLHLGFGPNRHSRTQVSEAVAETIEVVASEPGPTRDESPTDRAWWVAARLPFEAVENLSHRPVRPQPGSAWLANFYRGGGQTDPQYAAWNPILTPTPDFQRPEYFGLLRFGMPTCEFPDQ
jgi:hypothetical protein